MEATSNGIEKLNDHVQEKIGDILTPIVERKNVKVPVILAPSKILEARVWNCHCPPPVNTIKGHFAPMMSSFRRRKISIEVHKILPIQARVLTNSSDKKKKQKSNEDVKGHEEIYFRMLKPRRKVSALKVPGRRSSKTRSMPLDTVDDSSDEEDDDVSTVLDDCSISSYSSSIQDSNRRWRSRYKLHIFDVNITRCHRHTCAIVFSMVGKNGNMFYQTREVVFSSEHEAREFTAYVKDCQAKELMARENRVKSALGLIKLSPKSRDKRMKFLIDIVSAKNLPIGNKKSSDPYIVAMMGDKEVHRCGHVSNTLNPIWTIEKQSLFILDVTISELFERLDSGLVLLIKDYDFGSSHDYQGIAIVPPADIFNANEERIEYEVQPLMGAGKNENEDGEPEGKIAIANLRDALNKQASFMKSAKLPLGKNRDKKKETRQTNQKRKKKEIVSPLSSLLQIQRRRPTIVIRCRRATQYDEDFLDKCYNKKRRHNLIDSDEKNKTKKAVDTQRSRGQSGIRSMLEKKERFVDSPHMPTNSYLGSDKIKEFKVSPSADPERPEETEWMTHEDLEKEVQRPSKKWIDLCGGENLSDTVLGTVFIEVIKCTKLPQMDIGSALGNKTDAFVSVVYENNHGFTDVINDKLSPSWPPWSRRAFVFHMINPSSQLFLGVFDYDASIIDDHDFIGRVTVELTPFRPRTEYILNYNLMRSPRAGKREKKFGQITIRLRIEIDHPRHLGIVYLKQEPSCFVNVKTKKDFRCIRTTVYGNCKRDTFSIATISSYIEEIKKYVQHSQVYIFTALMHVFLWRSTLALKLYIPCPPFLRRERKRRIKFEDHSDTSNDLWWKRWSIECVIPIPIYSYLMCFTAFTVIDNIYLVPTYFFFWMGILLISTMHFRLTNPDPWSRCKTFSEVFQNTILGKCNAPMTIKARKSDDEVDAFTEYWETKIRESDEAFEERNKALIKAREEEERENEEIGDTINVATKHGFDFNPLKRILYPLQMWLCWFCEYLRFIRNVFNWEEAYISSIFTISCFLVAAFLYFVPWAFLIYWTSHIFVWTLFGPWMGLVDRFYIQKLKPLTTEEKILLERQAAERRLALIQNSAFQAQIHREYLVKLSGMKKYLFGKFMIKIPVYKLAQFQDIPLKSSTATPIEESSMTLGGDDVINVGEGRIREGSQQLVGLMIPQVGYDASTKASIDQTTRHKQLLNQMDPAMNIFSDSSKTFFVVGLILFISVVSSYHVIALTNFTSQKIFSHDGL